MTIGSILERALPVLSENSIALIALGISVSSALFSWGQKRQEMKIAWIRDLVSWSQEPMRALSRAEVEINRLPALPAEEAAAIRTELKARLSAAVDEGRLFFENLGSKRPDVLDPLMRAHRALDADPAKYPPNHLKRCMGRHRTEFWQLVQSKINPAWLRKAVGGPTATGGDGSDDFDVPDLPKRK
jgi:hypothetical protein